MDEYIEFLEYLYKVIYVINENSDSLYPPLAMDGISYTIEYMRKNGIKEYEEVISNVVTNLQKSIKSRNFDDFIAQMLQEITNLMPMLKDIVTKYGKYDINFIISKVNEHFKPGIVYIFTQFNSTDLFTDETHDAFWRRLASLGQACGVSIQNP